MSKLTKSIFKEDGTKILPAWLEKGRCLEHTSVKNRKNLERSLIYFRKQWLSCHINRTNFEKIDFVYKCCKELNEIFGLSDPTHPNYFVVDHIVPITHDDVCGFHCHWNLQIITNRENTIKSNNHWPDKYGDDLFGGQNYELDGRWLNYWIVHEVVVKPIPRQFDLFFCELSPTEAFDLAL